MTTDKAGPISEFVAGVLLANNSGQVYLSNVSSPTISCSNWPICESWPRHHAGCAHASPEANDPMSLTGWPRWMLLSAVMAITATFLALPAVRLGTRALQHWARSRPSPPRRLPFLPRPLPHGLRDPPRPMPDRPRPRRRPLQLPGSLARQRGRPCRAGRRSARPRPLARLAERGGGRSLFGP